MRVDAYYLIEARPALSERLVGRVKDDFREFLLEPLMLTNGEGGRTAWRDEDHCLTVKLSFLASLKDYVELSADGSFLELFGAVKLSTSLFDKWWTIRRFEVDDSVEELQPFVKVAAQLMDPTGNSLVDRWIERCRDA